MEKATCCVPGCTRLVEQQKMCSMHVSRLRRHGDVGGPEPTRRSPAKSEEERLARRREQCREARKVDRERKLARRRETYVRDHAKIREQKRIWRAANIESEKARHKRWNDQNKPRKAILQSRRRARERQAPGYSTPDQVLARIAYFGSRCWMCGAPWEAVDHVKPLAAGGSDWPANLRPICKSCNSRKGKHWSGVSALRLAA